MERFDKKYRQWLKHKNLNSELQKELLSLGQNREDIADRFYKDLEFGTAGLRGIIGAGTNRMNIYTIRKATQGLANYIKRVTGSGKVIIAYDTRHKSREFALEAALVLANNDIKAYLFDGIATTPLLSYTITYLGATAGIMVTASHNPREYNGYKVYWEHGGQIIDAMAEEITEEVKGISDELSVAAAAQKDAEKSGMLVWLTDEVYISYMDRIMGLILRPEIIAKMAGEIKIVYTSLHGTGQGPVTEILAKAGFTQVFSVPEQARPDPDFSTLKYPNPEEPAAFELALRLALEHDGDLIMATDPDADRVGVMAKNRQGNFQLLTGNQLGALLVDYILSTKKEQGLLPDNGVVIKTIVTSAMGTDIANSYGVQHMDVLTGFKYIGEKIAQFAQDKSQVFLFGYEESYGFLAGDFVRDKDAVQICLLAAEMASYYKSRGLTLTQRLEELFAQLGYYREGLVNIGLTGMEGQKKINRIINSFRDAPPQNLGGLEVVKTSDYLMCKINDLKACRISPTTLPTCNTLLYHLEDGSWFCIRPSGTEPKLKIYFGVKDRSPEKADTKLLKLKADVMERIGNVE